MNLDYLLLALALIGLMTPTVLFTSSVTKQRLRSGVRRRDEGLATLLQRKLNWFDLIRGIACTLLLQHQIFNFERGQDDLALVFTCTYLAVIAASVLIQSVLFGAEPCIIGPIFFVSGAAMVVSGPLVGCFAIALSLACALMAKRISLLFIFSPFCILVFGVIFKKMGITTMASAALFVIPAFLAFASGVRLSYLRKTTGSVPTVSLQTLPKTVAIPHMVAGMENPAPQQNVA